MRRNRSAACQKAVSFDPLEIRRLLAAETAFDLSPQGSAGTGFVRVGSDIVYIGTLPTTGTELLRTDGTAAGTRAQVDTTNGLGGSRIKNIAVTGNRVFYVAEAGSFVGLWRSDGVGTRSFLQAFESFDSTNYRGYGLAGSTYVYAFWDGSKEVLYANSGGANSTQLIASGFGAGSTLRDFTSVGNRLYFIEFRSDETYQLWSTDGTSAGTTQHNNAPLRRVFTMHQEGGELYIDAIRNRQNDNRRSLFAYSPTEGMSRVARATRPDPIGIVNSRLVFSMRNSTVGVILRTDQTSALPGTTDIRLDGAAASGNSVWYTNGAGQLWTSDGTSAGSSLRYTFTDPERLSSEVVAAGGRVYVSVNYKDGRNPDLYLVSTTPANPTLIGSFVAPSFFDAGSYLLVQSTSASGARVMQAVRDAAPVDIDGGFIQSDAANPLIVGNYDGKLIMASSIKSRADAPVTDTIRLFSSDGYSPAELVASITGNRRAIGDKTNPPSANVNGFMIFRVQRTMSDGKLREELWRTDGTSEGTYALNVFGPARGVRLLGTIGNRHIFAVNKTSDPAGLFSEIWSTTGTNRRTLLVQSLGTQAGRFGSAVRLERTDNSGTAPQTVVSILFTLGDKLFITRGTSDSTSGTEGQFPFGQVPTNLSELAVSNSRVWFFGNNPGAGGARKLYSTDGTPGGGRVVADPPAGVDITGTRLLGTTTGVLVYGKVNGRLNLYRITNNASAFNLVGGFFPNSDTVVDASVSGPGAYFNTSRTDNSTRSLVFYYTGASISLLNEFGEERLEGTIDTRFSTVGLVTYMNAGIGNTDLWQFRAATGTLIDRQTDLDSGTDVAEVASSVFFTGIDSDREVRRKLVNSRITGRLFVDANDNRALDPGEPTVPGLTIFVDRNRNGRLDSNEVSSVSDSEGRYALENISRLGDQDNTFAIELVRGTHRFTDEGLTVVFEANPERLDFEYRVITTPTVRGYAWTDTNGNSRRSEDEPGLPSRRIFADLDNDGVFDTNEPSAETDADGNYELVNLPQTATTIRIVVATGETLTTRSAHTVTVINGSSTQRNFGFTA
jgi:ELWxxDGT repeat protein